MMPSISTKSPVPVGQNGLLHHHIAPSVFNCWQVSPPNLHPVHNIYHFLCSLCANCLLFVCCNFSHLAPGFCSCSACLLLRSVFGPWTRAFSDASLACSVLLVPVYFLVHVRLKGTLLLGVCHASLVLVCVAPSIPTISLSHMCFKTTWRGFEFIAVGWNLSDKALILPVSWKAG